MPEIIIDNKPYPFDKPGKVLQFMLDHGLDLPFFCYHPSLSIPANCRQCVVKAGLPEWDTEKKEILRDSNGIPVINYFPKLMTACNLDLQDGLVIHTHHTDEEVKQAQADNLEFILINHPLDCAICDQAGECPLQILTYKYGPEGSRFINQKVHKPKAIRLGPRVMLDAERCINCTRCVRFTDEVSKTHQLTIISRGDKNYPETAGNKLFDDPYSINTADICPVGALTSIDFRFKARVWEMNQTASIDVTNGKGTNTWLWTRDNLILRITPRFNKEVNDHWMPDEARLAYHKFNENRISKPSQLNKAQQQQTLEWEKAESLFKDKIKEHAPSRMLVIGSPYASLEDNYAIKRYFTSLKATRFVFLPHFIAGSGDDFLLSEDQAPNTNGIRALGFEEITEDQLIKLTNSGDFDMAAIIDDSLPERTRSLVKQLSSLPFTVVWGTNHTPLSQKARLVIPAANASEHAASYVNVDGRIQRTFPAKETQYTNRRLNTEMSKGRLDHYGTEFDNWVNDKNRVDCIPVWEFITRIATEKDAFSWKSSRDVLNEISNNFSVFNGVSYERMDKENGILLKIKQLQKDHNA